MRVNESQATHINEAQATQILGPNCASMCGRGGKRLVCMSQIMWVVIVCCSVLQCVAGSCA